MKKIFTTYGKLCKLPLGWSLWGFLFFLIFATACTNDVAEVNTSQQQEQYVTVRMNVPGMQTSISRAADGEIESVTALAFNESKELLEVETIRTFTNKTNNSGTFSLTVPNGTTTIHFLANLPNGYDLKGVNEESDLCNLTSNDYGNTRYWGMTDYNGETELNGVVLYRDMARIKVVPVEDYYTEDQIIIAGLLNPNNTGKIVPYNYKDGFNFNLSTNDYYTLPDSVKQNVVYEGTYPNPLYVFEHDNPPTGEGLYVICKIAGYYYKIALLDNEGKPYDIIRNHEYTIYVSDLDVGETSYDKAKSADPINPPVVDNEIEEVTLTVNLTTASLYYDSDNTQQITVTVPYDVTLNQLTITPSVDCFTITSPSGQMSANNGVYTYAPNGGVAGLVTFTITPKSGYDFTNVSSSALTFSGSGDNMNVTGAQTDVTLTKKPVEVVFAVNPTNATINMDNDESSTTLTLTKPSTMKKLRIRMSDANAFNITGNNLYPWYENNNSDYCLDGIESESLEFTITLKDGFTTEGQYTITFYDYNNESNFVQSTVTIINTSNEEPEESTMSLTPETSTINLDSNGEKSKILTLFKPADVTAIKINHAGKFNVEVLDLNGYGSSSDDNNLYLNGSALENDAIDIQLKFTPKDGVAAGSYSITISEQNDDANSVSATITLANLGTGTEIWNEGKTLIDGDDAGGISLSYEQISQYAGWTMTIVLTTEGSDWKQIIVEKLSERGTHVLEVSGNTLNTSYSFTIPSTSELNNDGLIIFGRGGITVTNIYVEETDAS